VKRLALIIAGTVTAAAVPASAQPTAARAAAEQRYQIGQMERVLEGAVEHGVTVTRDRVQALAQVPADLLVSDNAHARGFRLEGYGVFRTIWGSTAPCGRCRATSRPRAIRTSSRRSSASSCR